VNIFFTTIIHAFWKVWAVYFPWAIGTLSGVLSVIGALYLLGVAVEKLLPH
jgi:hypothetical protein